MPTQKNHQQLKKPPVYPVFKLAEIRKLIDQVAKGSYNARAWVEEGPVNAYVRVTQHHFANAMWPTIDVAAVELLPEDRGHGYFTRWLSAIEALAHESGRAVYLESVLNKRMQPFYLRRGYQPIPYVLDCYYLLPPRQELIHDKAKCFPEKNKTPVRGDKTGASGSGF